MSNTLESELVVLKECFRLRAQTQSRTLAALADELERGTPPLQLQAEIRRLAHSLAGAGGTFGFGAISACAAELQEFVQDCPDSPELAAACRALVSEIWRTSQ
jgi:HPt (histidine-containing phosphotransfer) domain-containing protein